ncbi:MAG: hypothetical protein GY850_15635 [bacterium]|nr:hypothetical protein [bacterium]
MIALKSGDADRLVAALSGQGAPRKLTPEILSFINVRLFQIYQQNHYNYSIIIRKEIKEIFGKEIMGNGDVRAESVLQR